MLSFHARDRYGFCRRHKSAVLGGRIAYDARDVGTLGAAPSVALVVEVERLRWPTLPMAGYPTLAKRVVPVPQNPRVARVPAASVNKVP